MAHVSDEAEAAANATVTAILLDAANANETKLGQRNVLPCVADHYHSSRPFPIQRSYPDAHHRFAGPLLRSEHLQTSMAQRAELAAACHRRRDGGGVRQARHRRRDLHLRV